MAIPEIIKFILPESGIEFLNQTNGNCIYWHKKNLCSSLCLWCGSKICDPFKDCLVENKAKKKKEYSLYYHCEKCGGGNGLFMNVTDSEIIYILKNRSIWPKIYIYLNDFGETLKNTYMNDEYKLNKDELKKGIMKFIDMTYRKIN